LPTPLNGRVIDFTFGPRCSRWCSAWCRPDQPPD
jgi:hypothetical protein